MNVKNIDAYFTEIVMHLRKQNLIPIFGAGLTHGEVARKGCVPSAKEYCKFMLDEIVKGKQLSKNEKLSLEKLSFSEICDVYEDDDNVSSYVRRDYFLQKFTDVSLSTEKKQLLSVGWPYIYTLNIDDGIESNSNYNCVILPKREINDQIFQEKKCVIKLHGDVNEILKFKDGYKVFTSRDYLSSLANNQVLLRKLKHDYTYQNIIFIGCSLNDEIDIKALTLFSNNVPEKKEYSKVYYCTTQYPDIVVSSKLKTFGVTDVILFKDYSQIYIEIFKAWLEAKKVTEYELDAFSNFKVQSLTCDNVENAQIFYNGLRLEDRKNKTISVPYFFIERQLNTTLLNNLRLNTIHIIFGNRISGKTFFLLSIVKQIKDREVYYFSSNYRLNDKVFDTLLNKRNALIIFDNYVLVKKQIETILINANKIHINHVNIVIAINNSDGDILGLIGWKLKLNEINRNDFIRYDLDNTLSLQENAVINKLLPYCSLPPFINGHTILDNLSNSEHLMKGKHNLAYNKRLLFSTVEELALYIALATKIKLYSTEIFRFGLDLVVSDVVRAYPPFIERVETVSAEKDGTYAPVKYVLNAKYWLCRELGNFAKSKSNYGIILEAYQYLIRKLVNSTNNVEFEIRRRCREYIMFDTINEIFLNERNGQLMLCEQIYESLYSLLAGNYQYLHQYAKCCFRMSYAVAEKKLKLKYIEKGLNMAKVSAAMAEEEKRKKDNENILIAVAHIQYSIATLACEKCILSNLSNIDDINCAIEYATQALYSPYNKEEYLRDIKQRKSSIRKFLERVLNSDILGADKKVKETVQELFEHLVRIGECGRKTYK